MVRHDRPVHRAGQILCVIALLGASWLLRASPGAGADPEPPLPAPQWVRAVDRAGKVWLTWIPDPRFAAVRVYRSQAEGRGVFVPIGEVRGNSFTDETAPPGASYRYRLTAIGPDKREGRPSSELIVTVSALKPPSPPVWEGYFPLEGGVGLKWNRQEGADILVYNVYRRSPPETEYQLIGSTAGTGFLDTAAAPNRPYVYVLTALDSGFRETPFSAELPVVPGPPRPAEARKEPQLADWQPRRTRLVAIVTRGDQTLLRPADVAVGPRTGNVYLTDSGRGRVYVFGPRGDFLRAIGGAPGTAAALRRVIGVAVDADERVYAVDAAREAVLAYGSAEGGGQPVELPMPPRKRAPGLADCVAGGDGRLYVVDNANNRVLVAGGAQGPAVLGSAGFGPGEFSAPTFGALDADGNLYVADTLNARIQVFSPAGEFLRFFGRPARGPAIMGRPKGLAVGRNGEVYVADSWLNTILVFEPSGKPLAVLVDEEGRPLDLGSPNGIALGADNRIYIAERLSGRLQIREILDGAR
jgi:DNA-binding beta-propeller fold protein YncE